MVAFNFHPEFVGAIQRETKVQTIRVRRRCAPGDVMHLFTGMRTKSCVRLADRTCEVVDYVHLAPGGLTFGNTAKHPRDIDEFAQLDGFPTFEAMLAWLQRAHGTEHILGTVHRWRSAP